LIKSRFLKIAITFYFVALSQSLFRVPHFDNFVSIFLGMWGFGGRPFPLRFILHTLPGVILVLVAGHALDYVLIQRKACAGRPVLLYLVATAAFVFAILAGTRPTFIYFQF
jgi:hypothetical protein